MILEPSKIRSETIQLLEENIGRIFFDKNCSNTFLDVSLKAKAKKSKMVFAHLYEYVLIHLKKQG